MAILLKVKWVDKSDQSDPHQRIRCIGGDSRELQWKHTEAQAIESIERGLFAYYVEKDARALKLDVGLTADGKKYLTIQAGGRHPQPLLDLPECPNPAPVGSRPVKQA
jgi:hypothetical protein